MFETARAQSELFAFQCSQWELIWNSQLIGRYKEMSPGESYVWNCQSTEWTLHFSMWSIRAHLKQSTNRKISRNVTRWILQYTPPIWNCQRSEWTLHFSMQSMRAHLKQSTHRKISRNVTRWILQYTPPLSLWSKSWKWYTALHSMQLYIYLLSLYVLSHLELSKWTGQSCISFYGKFLSISVWFYHVVVVVVYYTTTYICCCCCVLHIRNNNKYKIPRNLLWSLC